MRGRAIERDLECALRRFFAHIVSRAIGALARYLAIRTRVLAAQRDDKEMKRCDMAQESHAAPQPQREKLVLCALSFSCNEMRRIGLFIEAVPRREV